jgi:protein phosphatase 2C family protein 2/3
MAGITILGPARVLPGKLSVSRTFGDCTAKFEQYGGNPKCIVAEPEIYKVYPDE